MAHSTFIFVGQFFCKTVPLYSVFHDSAKMAEKQQIGCPLQMAYSELPLRVCLKGIGSIKYQTIIR